MLDKPAMKSLPKDVIIAEGDESKASYSDAAKAIKDYVAF